MAIQAPGAPRPCPLPPLASARGLGCPTLEPSRVAVADALLVARPPPVTDLGRKGHRVSTKVGVPTAVEARPEVKPERSRRFELLELARRHTPWAPYQDDRGRWIVPPIRKCRRVRVEPGVEVLASPEGGAHLGGLETCQSMWECPCCAQSKKIEREHEVRHVVDAHKRAGGAVYMATFTVRHGWGDGLKATCDGLMAAWKAFIQGRQWVEFRQSWGVETIRAIEVTHGDNGWHPHLHVLMLVREAMGPMGEADVADWMYERWALKVADKLGEKHIPSPTHGTDFRLSHNAEYITKLGLELTDSYDSKETRGTNRAGRKPFEILAGLASDAADRPLWHDWVVGMKGRRFMAWSRGLKPAREAAAVAWKQRRADESEAAVQVAMLTAREWDQCRDVRGFRAALLDAAEHPTEAAAWVLDVVRRYQIRSHLEAKQWEKMRKTHHRYGCERMADSNAS